MAEALFDPDFMLECCDRDADLMAHLIASLRVSLPTELVDAHARLAAGDATGLREKAHRIQGMVSIASPLVAAVASELEDEAASNRLDSSAGLLARLDTMTMSLLTLLETVRSATAPKAEQAKEKAERDR